MNPSDSAGARRWPTRDQFLAFPTTLGGRQRRIARLATTTLILSALFLVGSFFQRHLQTVPASGGSYTEALLGSPKYVNPILSSANDVDADLTNLLFTSLYNVDKNGNVHPALADHEEVSTDGLTYVVTIHQDALWHDGQPVTSGDVAFTFDRIKDPSFSSPLQSSFKDVQVEVVSDFAVKFTLPKPYAPFLSTLTFGILPLHIWGDIPAANQTLTEYNLKPVGSGPFMFRSLTKDRSGNILSYQLVRFNDYFGDKPYLNEITFRFSDANDDMATALKKKEVDGIGFVSSDVRDRVTKTGANMRELRLPQYTAVFFNQSKNEALKDKAVRQALERATNTAAIVDQALSGAGQVIHSPILPGFLGYHEGVQGLAFNVEDAKRALDDAGWKLADGASVREKDGVRLHLTLTTVDRAEYVKTVQLLRSYWTAVGVGVDLSILASEDILAKAVKPRNYEALLFGEIVGIDPDPYPFWHSSQSSDPGLNLAVFYNKDVDQLLEEARQTGNLDQRREKYVQFQNILAEELPALFLYNPFYTYAQQRRVRGNDLTSISSPEDRFNDIDQWFVKTKLQWH